MILPSRDENRIMSPDYGIDLKSEAVERFNVRRAKWTILHDGNLLPVTNLFDSDGNEIQNPLRAVAVVAYDEYVAKDHWLTIGNVDPGEIWNRHEIPDKTSPQATRKVGHTVARTSRHDS